MSSAPPTRAARSAAVPVLSRGAAPAPPPATRKQPIPLPPKITTERRSGYVVWEITRKCNLACQHCGSRAGDAREKELTTAEAFDLIRQLADSGITEITLIGGEAYLRPDWLELVAAIDKAGMLATMVTGGYGISRATAQKMKDSGLQSISVSVDGLEKTHDFLRGVKGS